MQYEEVYPGIDLVYYGNQRQLEYDFIVAPGADPDRINLSFKGARNMHVDAEGDLVLRIADGEVRQRKPVIYQEVDGARREIAGRYSLKAKHQVGFQIAEYDASRPLVIDPVLSYSTYFGDNGGQDGRDIAVDSSGNAYITGTTLGANIPRVNALFPNYRGGASDAFVTKFNAAGTALIYSTFLGGRGVTNVRSGSDTGTGIAVDSSGNAYVTGITTSIDFPTFNPLRASGGTDFCSFFPSIPCPDNFVTKLNAAGSALLYSTYLGGTRGSQLGALATDIAVDSAGHAYVTGSTNGSNFPISSNAFQTMPVNAGFLTRLNTIAAGEASLVYSTFLSGAEIRGIAVDASGDVYLAGSSNSFPTTENAFQRVPKGVNALVLKLRTNPAACTPDASANIACKESLLYSSYLGGRGDQSGNGLGSDEGSGIAVDSSGGVYVTGRTTSLDFPTTANAFRPNPNDSLTGFVTDAFVAKLNVSPSTCTPAAGINCPESLLYSTYLGGSASNDFSEQAHAIAVDSSGNVYVTGETGSSDFPVKAPFQGYRGGGDAFVTKLNPNASGAESLVYSTYLGGSDTPDIGRGIAVDPSGDVYVVGQTFSNDFPTTAGAFQVTLLRCPFCSFDDVFVSKISPDARSFLVSTIWANKGGNTGFVSTLVYGAGFESGATVRLARSGLTDIPGEFLTVTGGGQIAATFDLTEKEKGLWDVVVTNPNGASVTLREGFTIEAGRQLEGYVDIFGQDNFRPGGTGRVVVTYGNPGNTDALLPIFIRIPKDIGFTLPVPILHQPLIPTDEPFDLSGLPMTIDIPDDPTTPMNEAETIIPLIVNVPPGSTGSIPITLKHPRTNCSGVQIKVSVGAPVNPGDLATCLATVVQVAAGFIPGEACVKAALSLLVKANVSLTLKPASLSSWIASSLLGIVKCAADVFPPSKVITTAIKIVDLIAKANSGNSPIGALRACAPFLILEPNFTAPRQTGTLTTSCVNSGDPNDKIGSSGTGAARFLSGEESLRYVILFENKPVATAAAQDVVITDQLDKNKLDFTTFSLGPIAFGDKTVVPPSGLSEFNTDVDLRPANTLIVRINAKLNTETGLLTWRFASLDPATMQPTEDPLAGFLPPNVNPPEGDGAVFFSVMPRAGLATGTEIRNGARIVFDVNEPIDTPEWLNTMDNSNPQSRVLPLPATQTSSSFAVSWSGTDTGSGIGGYSIFVSENGGPFTTFLGNTTATSATFTGQANKSYGFFSVARDNTGNVEGAKSAPEVTTSIINLDQINPVTVATLSRAPNANGWHDADVLVTLNAVDKEGGSGVKEISYTISRAQLITGETVSGASVSIPVTTEGVTEITFYAKDNDGNTEAAQTLTVRLDKSVPVITGTRSISPNAAGWNNSDVTVSFNCADAVSGVASCTDAMTFTSDDANQSVTGTAIDQAGNSASAIVDGINIDKTAPTINASRAPSGNANGWNNTNVTASYTASDSVSGLDANSPATGSDTFTAEGTGQSRTFTVQDLAGNSASATIRDVNIDKTAPLITAFSPLSGAMYLLNQAVIASYTCADVTSGLASCVGVLPSGASVPTGVVGPASFAIEATDVAGNIATASIGYAVRYGFAGFFSPLANLPAVNLVNAGRTIPAKWRLTDARGVLITDVKSFVSLTSAPIACDASAGTTVGEEGSAAGETTVRYDSDASQFVFNWKTQSGWSGCRLMQVSLADGSTHVAKIRMK